MYACLLKLIWSQVSHIKQKICIKHKHKQKSHDGKMVEPAQS
jgi:hypothetical protein